MPSLPSSLPPFLPPFLPSNLHLPIELDRAVVHDNIQAEFVVEVAVALHDVRVCQARVDLDLILDWGGGEGGREGGREGGVSIWYRREGGREGGRGA